MNYVYDDSNHTRRPPRLWTVLTSATRVTPALVDDWGKRGSLETPEIHGAFPVEPEPCLGQPPCVREPLPVQGTEKVSYVSERCERYSRAKET